MVNEYDAIIIGAGHNGLTSAAMLAGKGLKVLCLEQNGRAGGMAITRELFKGYKHNVGAWALLVFKDEMIQKLELEKYNLEMIRPESSYCVFGDPKDSCFIGFTDKKKMGKHLLKDHGIKAITGLARLDKE
ncbi:MAG: NAD(P)/FAD-dependent oxidoreductase, partial [Spirochaetaceae bacterium]|nr:NAD(P)/FAD-dependent oxidoreductase [Spirochaetaceae bacterium]